MEKKFGGTISRLQAILQEIPSVVVLTYVNGRLCRSFIRSRSNIAELTMDVFFVFGLAVAVFSLD